MEETKYEIVKAETTPDNYPLALKEILLPSVKGPCGHYGPTFYKFENKMVIGVKVLKILFDGIIPTAVELMDVDGKIEQREIDYYPRYGSDTSLYRTVEDTVNRKNPWRIPHAIKYDDLIKAFNCGEPSEYGFGRFFRFKWDGRGARAVREYGIRIEYVDASGVYVKIYEDISDSREGDGITTKEPLPDGHPFWKGTYHSAEACVNDNKVVVRDFGNELPAPQWPTHDTTTPQRTAPSTEEHTYNNNKEQWNRTGDYRNSSTCYGCGCRQ